MKSLYLLLIAFSFVLVSCSSSYRSSQTVDDVYYSPAVEVENGYSSNQNNDDGDYVTMQDDESSYGYRNDVQEEWQIRRGIRNPFYRNSISLSFGLGGYSPYYYDPFYTPLFSPYSYYGYSGLWNNPFYYNYGWLNYSPYYSYGHLYNPYVGYYGNYYPHYGSYNSYPYGRTKDNGPRVMNINRTRTGITQPRINNNPDRPILAPIRTMRNNNNRNGTIERRVTPRNNTDVNRPVDNKRNVRKFNNNRRSNDYRTPAPTQNRRYTPPRRNDVSPTPNRTFERPSTPSVDRTPSTPPSNNNGNKSAPVRKF